MSIKHSTASSKDSPTSIKDSTVSIKDSSASIKDSTVSIKHSTVSIKDSTVSIKHSSVSIKDSTVSIKDLSVSIKDSSVSIKDSLRKFFSRRGAEKSEKSEKRSMRFDERFSNVALLFNGWKLRRNKRKVMISVYLALHFIGKTGFPHKVKRASDGTPDMFIGFWVASSVKADKFLFVNFKFAI
jgi:hypothetical protein